jgi:signal peptidase II
VLVGLLVALGVTIFDQLSKSLIFGYLSETAPVVEVFPFFNLVTAWNTGVSFSMFNDLGGMGVYVLSSFSLLVAGMLIYWLKNEHKRYMQVALGMVIGGAIGNVIDRVRLGAVFDFLDVHAFGHHWPAFNVADSFICIGAFLIIIDGLCAKDCKKVQNFHEGIDE